MNDLDRFNDNDISEEDWAAWHGIGIPSIPEVIPEEKKCQHEWKAILGLFEVYYNCKICDKKKEEV